MTSSSAVEPLQRPCCLTPAGYRRVRPSVSSPLSSGCPVPAAAPAAVCSTPSPGSAPPLLLGQALTVSEQPLHLQEGVLYLGPYRRLESLRKFLTSAGLQPPLLTGPHRHLPVHLSSQVLLTFVDSLIPGIASHHRLPVMQRIVRLRYVVRVESRLPHTHGASGDVDAPGLQPAHHVAEPDALLLADQVVGGDGVVIEVELDRVQPPVAQLVQVAAHLETRNPARPAPSRTRSAPSGAALCRVSCAPAGRTYRRSDRW